MIERHKRTPGEDDDLDLGEELEDGEEHSLLEDEAFSPDDDSDLGLESEERELGLDIDSGLEDAGEGDEDELGDDDEESWLDEGEFDPSLEEDDAPDEDEDELPSEGGVLDEPHSDWDDDFELDENGVAATADAGEEGFGDESSGFEVDVDRLPPLDDAAAAAGDDEVEDELEELASELIGDLDERTKADDAIREIAPGLRCARVAARDVQVQTLARLGRPLGTLVSAGDTGVGWDGSLLVAGGSAARAERRYAEADAVYALSALQTDDALLIALATPEGLLCSSDGGRSFTPAAALPEREWASSSIAWTLAADGSLGARLHSPAPALRVGARLWAAPPGAALWASDDHGRSFARRGPDAQVLRLRSDCANTLVALCRRADGGASALGSNDGGEAFAWLELPVREAERAQDVQAVGGVVLCCRRAPEPQLVWRMAAHDWAEVAPGALAPAVLVEEDEQVSAYFFARADKQHVLLRRVLAARAPAPQIVCELAADAGVPLQLAAGQRDGVTTLQVGCERAWYRVRVLLAGDNA